MLGIDYRSPKHWDSVHLATRGAATSSGEAVVASLLRCLRDEDAALAGRELLDAGCGDGELTRAATADGARATALDFSPAAVRAVRSGAGSSPARAVRGDATRLPFGSCSFDFVACLRSLWTFPSAERFLVEARRVLVPGGRLAVQLWDTPERNAFLALGSAVLGEHIPELRIPAGMAGPNDWTPSRLHRELTASGFGDFRLRRFRLEVPIAGPEEFWREYRAHAGTAYLVLSRQSPSLRRAVDEAWRSACSTPALPLGWTVLCASRT